MSATVADTQVRTYLDAVKAHLDDLPEDDRDELLEDLEEHLLEVAAEDEGTLEQRLGAPADYAEELRASAGLPSRDEMLSRRPGQRVADRLAQSGLWRSSARVASSSQMLAFRAFLRELLPGWWVLRGYLAVVALVVLTDNTGRDDFPLPAPLGSRVSGVAFIVLAILLSVWIGRRAQRRRKGRRLSIVLSVAIAIAGIAAVARSGSTSYTSGDEAVAYESVPFLHHEDGSPIANICPYGSDGKLLSGVLLFDQNGRAILNVSDALPDGRPVLRSQPAILNAYPQALFVPDDKGQFIPDDKGQMVRVTCPPSIGAPAPPVSPAPSPGP